MAGSESERRGGVVWWLARQVSLPGLAFGVLFFALSLTPSLIPRDYLVQGLLSGCVLAAGYAVGATLDWVWRYLGFRLPDRVNSVLILVTLAICTAIAGYSLSQAGRWQNAMRAAMGEGPVADGHPLLVIGVALVPAVALIAIGTLVTASVRRVANLLAGMLPPRVAFIGSLVIVGAITALLFSGVLLRAGLRAADAFYAEFDTFAGRSEICRPTP